jgi:hypothetical protein
MIEPCQVRERVANILEPESLSPEIFLFRMSE